jgi:hypothetical protein
MGSTFKPKIGKRKEKRGKRMKETLVASGAAEGG